MYQKNLEYLGLSEKEAVVYSALLKVDKAQAILLARQLSMKPPTIYVILDSLLRKHLVYEVQVGKRAFYAAESPDALRTLVEMEKAEADIKIKRAERIIAELKTVDKDSGERPTVRFYEGKEALKQSIKEYVEAEDFSEGMDYGIYSYDLLPKIFDQKSLIEIEQKRIKNNIRFRALYTGEQKVIDRSSKLQESVKLDQDQFPIECDIGIFKDEVRFHTAINKGESPSGIVIKNREIATTLKSIIDYIFALRASK